MLNKKYILLFAAILLGIIGFTIAYFNNYNEKQNAYYASNYDVHITSEWDDSWGNKSITIKNEGTTPVALRLSYKESWSKEIEDENININNLYRDESVVTKEWSNTFLNDFTYIDGWYYYNKILNSNDIITILNGVNKKNTNGSYNYSDYTYELSFHYETVQSTKRAIKSLWNIDTNINNNDINWSS